MTCSEKGCATLLTVANAFVTASVADIAAVAGKKVVDLTVNDLVLFAICDECEVLHRAAGDAPSISWETAVARIRGQKEIERQKTAAASLQAELTRQRALRAISSRPLGAALLNLGFTPKVQAAAR